MRALRDGVLLLILGAAASSVFAQRSPFPTPEPTGPQDYTESPVKPEISGYVKFPQGQGTNELVLVRLETSTGTLLRQAWAGRFGYFTIPEVSCGNYVLAVDVSGYSPVRVPIEHSFIPPGAIFLRMVPVEGGSAAAAEAAASARDSKYPARARQEYSKGLEALAKKKADESVRHFRKAIEISPAYDDAYFQLGWAHFQQRQYGDAQRALDKTITLNEKNAQAYALLGAVYRQQNQFQDAIQALEHSLRLEENSCRAHLELGETLLKLGRVNEAYPHVTRAHSLNPGLAPTHIALYNSLILRNDYQAAVAELEEFLRLFPDNALAARARQQRDALAKVVAAKH